MNKVFRYSVFSCFYSHFTPVKWGRMAKSVQKIIISARKSLSSFTRKVDHFTGKVDDFSQKVDILACFKV